MNNSDEIAVIYGSYDYDLQDPLVVIGNIEKAEVTEKLNSSYDLDITIPKQDGSELLKADNYIKIFDNTFKVLETESVKDSSGMKISAKCEQLYFELLDDYIEKVDRLTLSPREAADHLNNFTNMNLIVEDSINDDVDKYPKRRLTISRGSPIKTINRMLDYWDMDLLRVDRDVIFTPGLNKNKIQLFDQQKNLVSLKKIDNGGQMTTRLYAIGKEGLTFDGLNIDEIDYKTETEGGLTKVISADGVVLGELKSKDGLIVGSNIDSKYINSYPNPRNDEFVDSNIEDKKELLYKAIEEINEKDSLNTSYDLDIEELKGVYGEIEEFGLGYRVILRDEDLLPDKDNNLVEARITEYTYNPLSSGETSKVKIGYKRNAIADLLGKIDDGIEEENKEDDPNGDIGQPEEPSKPGLPSSNVVWNSNNESLLIGNEELEVARLSLETEDNSDGQGQLLINLSSDKESILKIRLYDNDIEELYSPLIQKVNVGYNSIGIPNGIYNRMKGTHELTVTMSSDVSNVIIQPRGVSYNVVMSSRELDKISSEVMDISIKNYKGEREVYLITESTNNKLSDKVGESKQDDIAYPVIMSAPYLLNQSYSADDFNVVWKLDYLKNYRNLMLEYNGFFEKPTGESIFELHTQEDPWIFWINDSDELWAQHGNDATTASMLSGEVIQASAVRGWSVKNERDGDMGLVVAYVKYGGSIHYKQLRGLMNDIEQNVSWSPEYTVEEAGSGNSEVYISRLNDYRLAFSVKGVNKIFITDREYVGQASPTEYVNSDAVLDDWMTLITVIPMDEDPYDLSPTWSTEDKVNFYVSAPYEWNIRGDKREIFNLIKNTSNSSIKDVYVNSLDRKILVIEMAERVSAGELVVTINPEHLIGRHVNGSRVELTGEYTLFYIRLEEDVNEFAYSYPKISDLDLKITQLGVKHVNIVEYVNSEVNISSTIDVTKVELTRRRLSGIVYSDISIELIVDVIKSSEVIT